MSSAPSTLDPAGPAAASIAALWWVMLAVAAAVYVLVIVLLALALRRASRAPLTGGAPLGNRRFVLLFGAALPVVILVAMMVLTVRTGIGIADPGGAPGVRVDVVGHQFWWEVRYPDRGIVTANEIHIPVGTPVALTLTSVDVIHSFWVPQLAGKMDLIPGHETELVIQADEPGVYEGLCAEYCGIQHAKMHFLVVAEPRADYEVWADRVAEPAGEPVGELAAAGREVFLGASCVHCHAIQGVNDIGGVGPDLTHFGSRLTIAAGILPNTRGHLGGWIMDPQGLKPGVRMPPSDLDGEELQALLAYLEGLR